MRPPRADDDGSVYGPVLDGGAGGGLVGEAVHLEGPLALLEALLHPLGGRRRARHSHREVTWRDPGGGPGERPEGEDRHQGDEQGDRHRAAVGCGGHEGASIRGATGAGRRGSHLKEGSFVLRPGPTVGIARSIVKKERSF